MSKSKSQEIGSHRRSIYKKSSIITTPDVNVDRMSKEDLIEQSLELQDEITNIKEQLGRAESYFHKTGEYQDPDWYFKAKHAKEIKGRLIQKIQFEISKIKKKEKKEKKENELRTESVINLEKDNLGLTDQDWRGFKRVVKVLQSKVNQLED